MAVRAAVLCCARACASLPMMKMSFYPLLQGPPTRPGSETMRRGHCLLSQICVCLASSTGRCDVVSHQTQWTGLPMCRVAGISDPTGLYLLLARVYQILCDTRHESLADRRRF